MERAACSSSASCSGSSTSPPPTSASAREEIDALNVYPVPDGDTGTNMFLTMSAARDALREATGGDPDADLRAGAARLLPRRPARCPRQLRRDPVPDDRRDRRPAGRGRPRRPQRRRCSPRRCTQATDASYAAVGDPGRGHHPDRRPRRQRRGARGRRRPERPARRRRRGGRSRGPRGARAAPPTSCQCSRDAGVVDAGGRGLCVILDAAETVLTGRRPAGRRPASARDTSRCRCRPTT